MPLKGFSIERTEQLIREALDRNGVATREEWVQRHPGEHLWVELPFDGHTVPACACCTSIRFGRDGTKNKPCRGIAPPVQLPRDGTSRRE
jgi:hypothetical protein